MSEAGAYLSHLRQAGALAAPATEEELSRWRSLLPGDLPVELLQVYSLTNGSTNAERLAMRLLRHHEVVEDSQCIRDRLGTAHTRTLQAFWTDDNSNYAGVFLGGPLEGMVAFIDQEELFPLPVYSSVSSFLSVLTRRPGMDWSKLALDYPRAAASGGAARAREQSLRDLFIAESSADTEDAWPACVALQFVSTDDSELVRAFLASADMWVQAAACETAGKLRMDELLGDLERIAVDGMHNGRVASILALKQLRTPRADEALRRLRPKLGPGFEVYFR